MVEWVTGVQMGQGGMPTDKGRPNRKVKKVKKKQKGVYAPNMANMIIRREGVAFQFLVCEKHLSSRSGYLFCSS